MGKTIFVILGIFILIGIFGSIQSKGETNTKKIEIALPTLSPISADRLFDTVNKWRVDNGYPAYIKSDLLCQIAEKRLKQIKTDWSHDGFMSDDVNCGEVKCHLGENLAKDINMEGLVLTEWLKSPKHLENLKYNYKYSCIKSEDNFVVHIFGNFY